MRKVEKGQDTTSEDSAKSKVPLYVSIGILAAVVSSYFFIPDVKEFLDTAWDVLTSDDEARIKAWVDGFGWYGPFIIVIAMVVQMFLLVIPTILLMVVSILAYGPVWGGLIILTAVFSASSVGYVIGRYLGKLAVMKLIGQTTARKMTSFIEDYGFWAIVVTRINPFLSNDAISFVAGILRMGYWRFVAATLVGITPLIIYIAIIGQDTEQLQWGLLWGSVISLVLFLLYVWWDKRRRK